MELVVGWNGLDQIYREYPCAPGAWWVQRQQGATRQVRAARRLRLFFKANIPLAVVEAKDNAGMRWAQA
jgi:type I restriction enzyme R subunit